METTHWDTFESANTHTHTRRACVCVHDTHELQSSNIHSEMYTKHTHIQSYSTANGLVALRPDRPLNPALFLSAQFKSKQKKHLVSLSLLDHDAVLLQLCVRKRRHARSGYEMWPTTQGITIYSRRISFVLNSNQLRQRLESRSRNGKIHVVAKVLLCCKDQFG